MKSYKTLLFFNQGSYSVLLKHFRAGGYPLEVTSHAQWIDLFLFLIPYEKFDIIYFSQTLRFTWHAYPGHSPSWGSRQNEHQTLNFLVRTSIF